MESISWFTNTTCKELNLLEYSTLNKKKPDRKIKINDSTHISYLISSISELPVRGDKSIEWGTDTRYVALKFQCEDQVKTVEFYEKSIKTPAGTFFSDSVNEVAWNIIVPLLNKPKFGVPLVRSTSIKHDFGDFKIGYIKSEDRTPENTTATSYVSTYNISYVGRKKSKIIEVHSGQLPPQPLNFNVGDKGYTLHPFKYPSGSKLPPFTFILIEQSLESKEKIKVDEEDSIFELPS